MSETSSGVSPWWRQDDWWAVVLGLGLIVVGWALFASGSSLSWVAVTPARWTSLPQLAADFAAKWPRYLAQLLLWLVLIPPALASLGYRLKHTVPAFLFLSSTSSGIIGFYFARTNHQRIGGVGADDVGR